MNEYMKVKKRKTEYKPYKTINNEYVTIMWDYKPVTKTNAMGVEVETPVAIWQEYTFNYIPNLNEIKKVILDYYNSIIQEKIISGMVWKNMKVWLSYENQLNYKTIYDLALQTSSSNLPIKIKFGSHETPEYYEFNDIEELKNFYMSCVAHIQKTLNDGWILKDSINWNYYK